MSYQVLARKWRPQTFKEVIGQPHVLTALENGLTQDRVHHAYLFSGTRGVGKTTIARILAKSLNCEIGVTATPCGKCANCQAIDQGRFVDLLEIDAASRTKVDDTRELLDNVQYKPAQGRYKVYLIDEVHMLSKHSFNALLKTLEEPPEYVKFLLATTDPQKLPITVLSRCLQFHLKAILPEQIEHQLAEILKHEKATFEQAALGVIAKAADGSMRDALSLTDQALAFGAGNIEYNAVLKMLGTIDQSHLHYLLHFIASGNSQKVFEKIQEFVHLGADFSALHQELASLCHQIALIQLQLNANVSKKSAVQLLAERLTPEEVQLFYQIAVQGFKDYAFAPNGKIALEMTVMRLLAFKPANYVDVDESMLTQANKAQTSLTTTASATVKTEPTSLTAPQQATSTIEAQVVEPQPSIPATQEPVSEQAVTHTAPTIEQATGEVDMAQSTVNLAASEQPLTSAYNEPNASAITPENSQPIVQPNTEAQAPLTEKTVSPVLDTSQSRNMLRSHRLKREAIKKTEAAAEQQSSNINDRSAAATTQSAATKTAAVSNNTSSNASANVQANSNISSQTKFDNRTQANVSNDQDLPPLSSYQEQPATSHYQEYNDADYFEQQTANLPPNNYSTNEQATATSHAPEQPVAQQTNQLEPAVVTAAAAASRPVATVNDDISALNSEQNNVTDVELVSNDNIQALEVDIANYVEDKMTDEWFLAIKEMQLVGFEKLLAKSTVMQKQQQHIQLTLHQPQQHLLNNQSLCEDLKSKLRDYYGQQYAITIEAGNVPGQHTPMELEQIVYQQYLDNAKASIKNDPIVQTFVRDYAAKVYENSVVPL